MSFSDLPLLENSDTDSKLWKNRQSENQFNNGTIIQISNWIISKWKELFKKIPSIISRVLPLFRNFYFNVHWPRILN